MGEKIENPQVEAQRQALVEARRNGRLASLKTFVKFSGPGWLQSATTLGGGSLASALYLGVLGGFCFMWLQPFAMILGIIMLAAISYVTLSISGKPMQAINREISPILGYGWAIGSMLACFVFAMPQFALGVAAVEQNIAVGAFRESAFLAEYGKYIITGALYLVAMFMIVIYAGGGRGIKILEYFVKLSVAAIVICFFGVVIQLWWAGQVQWGRVFAGFVPNFSVLSEPSPQFMEYINRLGAEGRSFWSAMIVGQQRDVVISAAAMAVGINMTFLFPYSMLKKGWNRDFRGLAIFDLATGLFIPFLLATSCIVIAAATEFHAKPAKGLADSHWVLADAGEHRPDFVPVLALDGASGKWAPMNKAANPEKVLAMALKMDVENRMPAGNLVKPYFDLLDQRLAVILGAEEFAGLTPELRVQKYNSFDENEKAMAAMLVKRDASNLADTLAPLLGDTVARYIFGFGVLGMAMNAVLMNMLICGLSFSEIFNRGGRPGWQVAGSGMILVSAFISLFWEGARMWLVIYAGVMAAVLLPIAYLAFLAIMNSKKIMGDAAPRGKARAVWNTLMCVSLAGSSVASVYVLNNKIGSAGPALFFGFLLLVLASWGIRHFKKA